MIPERLENWTYEVINGLVARNTGESDRHDFKSNIPNSTTLTKICCAFANTKGGFIVFGVKEANSRFKITGIKNDKELAHRFGQKIHASPTIGWDLPKLIEIPNSNKVLAVFHLPLSPERPHIPKQRDRRVFWKRTNQGNEQMTYEEIRMSFQNYEERREKLKLLYLELLVNMQQTKAMKIDDASKESYYSIVTLDSDILNSLLIDLYTIIGRNKDLIRTLFNIRATIRIINNKIKIFNSQIAIPRTNIGQLVKNHNEFINDTVEKLTPLFASSIQILERDFALKNPMDA